MITQKQLGALTKMSASFIGEMERGLKAPNLEGIVAIAWALCVSVEEIAIDQHVLTGIRFRLSFGSMIVLM